jgi:hypothetical protein
MTTACRAEGNKKRAIYLENKYARLTDMCQIEANGPLEKWIRFAVILAKRIGWGRI